MDYDQAVTEGRTLLARSEHDQWALARLTHRVVVAHGKSMAQWSRDLGVSLSHVSNLRNVWAKYGDLYDRKALTNQSFNECYVLARASEERAERIGREAEETGRGAGTVEREPREKDRAREDFHRRLRDTRALKEAARDPETRERLREFFEEEFPDVRRRPDREPEPERTPQPEPASMHEVLRDLTGARERFYRGIGLLIRSKLNRAQRVKVKAVTDDIENGVDWVNSFLDSGDTSFTEMLEAFAREEGIVLELPETAEPRTRRREPTESVTPPDSKDAGVDAEPLKERPARERREPATRNGPRRRDRGVPT